MLTPLKAIWEKCLDCCCGQYNEVSSCKITTCPLHSFRIGPKPKEKRIPGNVEEKENTLIHQQ